MMSPERYRLMAMTDAELDEAVRDAKADEASEINQGGREGQIEYLMGGFASAPRHDPSNNNCPMNADPRNESCGCGQ